MKITFIFSGHFVLHSLLVSNLKKCKQHKNSSAEKKINQNLAKLGDGQWFYNTSQPVKNYVQNIKFLVQNIFGQFHSITQTCQYHLCVIVSRRGEFTLTDTEARLVSYSYYTVKTITYSYPSLLADTGPCFFVQYSNLSFFYTQCLYHNIPYKSLGRSLIAYKMPEITKIIAICLS